MVDSIFVQTTFGNWTELSCEQECLLFVITELYKNKLWNLSQQNGCQPLSAVSVHKLQIDEIEKSKKVIDRGLRRFLFQYMFVCEYPASREFDLNKFHMCAGAFQGHHVNPYQRRRMWGGMCPPPKFWDIS